MAALDFPDAPLVGDTFPAAPVAGQPVYRWTGVVWTTIGAGGSVKSPIYSDGSVAMDAQLTLNGNAGVPVNPNDASSKGYVDARIDTRLSKAGNQVTTGGFGFTAIQLPYVNFTVDPFKGNYQYFTNMPGSSMFITAPTVDCAVDILVTNHGSGGSAISFLGFTVGPNTGDPFTTTANARFLFSIRRIATISTYVIKALQ